MKYTKEYLKEITEASQKLNRSFLVNKTIALSGATGMILSYLIDALLIDKTLKVKLIALVRDLDRAKARFEYFKEDSRLTFMEHGLASAIECSDAVDYVIHGASTTDPKQYHDAPVETMLINFTGAYHLLQLAKDKKARFLLLSSTEVYGIVPEKPIQESDLGYLNLLDPRSSYNEAKRATETLCASFHQEYQVDYVIARLSRTFGPTMKLGDTKALSQFIQNAIDKKPIVLKSAGLQTFSYLYVFDAVSALLLLLQSGRTQEAYNVANPEVHRLLDLAHLVGRIAKVPVTSTVDTEKGLSYSKAQYAIQDITKIIGLGFRATISIEDGLKRTLALIQKVN